MLHLYCSLATLSASVASLVGRSSCCGKGDGYYIFTVSRYGLLVNWVAWTVCVRCGIAKRTDRFLKGEIRTS